MPSLSRMWERWVLSTLALPPSKPQAYSTSREYGITRPSFSRDGGTDVQIGGDRLARIDVQGQDPELAALPRAHGQRARALRDLDIGERQAGELADADPRVAEGQHDGQVARVPMPLDRPDQAVHVALLEPAGCSGCRCDPFDVLGRQLLRQAYGLGPLEEPSEGGQAAVDRGGLASLDILEVAPVLADIGWRHRIRVRAVP